MSKNILETEGPQMTLQYGAYALHAGLAKLHAHMRVHTPTHHRPVSNTAFFTATIFRERASVLRYR